jgi:adenosylhomocysteine nucleosidase
MILAATGLQRERLIVAGPEVQAVAGGGDHVRLEALLDDLAAGSCGIISIGIAGGLAPQVRVGDWIVAEAVLVDNEPVLTDRNWTRRIALSLPGAMPGLLVGSDSMVANSADKATLHRSTGAIAVDMESHAVSRVAGRHRLPFVAARVISDAAHRTLPPAARVGMKPDGRVDLVAVLGSLLRDPGQLPALVQTGIEALLRGHRRLGPRLGGPDLRELVLDVP